MDKKTTGIIATVATTLLCGCPGLFLCLFGALSTAGLGTFNLNERAGGIPRGVGISILCVGILFVVIPIAVAFFTLRTKKTPEVLPVETPPPPPPAAPTS